MTAYTSHLVSHTNLCDLWQGKMNTWSLCLFWAVAFKTFKKPTGQLSVPVVNIFGLNCPLWAPCMPFLVLLPRSAIQTKTSLPVCGSFWSSKFPQHSFWLSSLAWKPKLREKNHHNVRWSPLGLWQPNLPLSNDFSSSSVVNSRHAVGLSPCPCVTRFFRLVANTSLEWQNSSSWGILKGSFNFLRWCCRGWE